MNFTSNSDSIQFCLKRYPDRINYGVWLLPPLYFYRLDFIYLALSSILELLCKLFVKFSMLRGLVTNFFEVRSLFARALMQKDFAILI